MSKVRYSVVDGTVSLVVLLLSSTVGLRVLNVGRIFCAMLVIPDKFDCYKLAG